MPGTLRCGRTEQRVPLPRVSICMPAYNAVRFIGEALESALRQTYPDFEVVIWDDGSTDGTPEAVRSFGDNRVRLFTTSENRGPAHSTNMTMRLARAPYIKFLHDDDVLEPTCLERLLEVMEANEAVSLAFSRREVRDERAPEERTAHPEPHRGLRDLSTINDGPKLFEQLMDSDFKLNFIGEPSNVMIRRAPLSTSGLCNTRVRQLLDLDLWLRLIYDGAVGFVDEKLARYRFHSASLTTLHVDRGLQWLDVPWLLEGLATVPALWARYPQLAKRRASARARLPRDLAWLARNRQLRGHHLRDAASYASYLVLAEAGRPPTIVESLTDR